MPISGVMSPSAKPAFIAEDTLPPSAAKPGKGAQVAAAISSASTGGHAIMDLRSSRFVLNLRPTAKLRILAASCHGIVGARFVEVNATITAITGLILF